MRGKRRILGDDDVVTRSNRRTKCQDEAMVKRGDDKEIRKNEGMINQSKKRKSQMKQRDKVKIGLDRCQSWRATESWWLRL